LSQLYCCVYHNCDLLSHWYWFLCEDYNFHCFFCQDCDSLLHFYFFVYHDMHFITQCYWDFMLYYLIFKWRLRSWAVFYIVFIITPLSRKIYILYMHINSKIKTRLV
jgi:hypothetical protein